MDVTLTLANLAASIEDLWKRYPDRRAERAPFIWTILLFVLMFIGLPLAVFSYIIPLG